MFSCGAVPQRGWQPGVLGVWRPGAEIMSQQLSRHQLIADWGPAAAAGGGILTLRRPRLFEGDGFFLGERWNWWDDSAVGGTPG